MKKFILFALLAAASLAAAVDRPNIVFIFIDDMGYGDIGPFGSTRNPTPELDRMAKEGMKLTDYYVSATECTPSRSALMTGCYADRIGMDGRVNFPAGERGLNPSEITIAELLKTRGYATGCFGKWHLGDDPKFLPLAQGFDEFGGIPYSCDMWSRNPKFPPLPYLRGNDVVAHISDGASQSLLCQVITDDSVDFIKRHSQEPFFLYVAHAYVHGPRFARKELFDRAEGDVVRAQIGEVDWSTGQILKTLKELGLDDNTLVIFTSDNGGGAGRGNAMGPLRGAKGSPKYEGHMRVPTLAWWPGTIAPGSQTAEIATTADMLPTFAKLAGAKVPTDRVIDGKDVSSLLLDPSAKSPHELLYYEAEGIRRGPWKLVRLGNPVHEHRGYTKVELYNLDEDLGEANNLAAKHPDLVKELVALLDEHQQRVEAGRRPAAFVKNPKPLLESTDGIPALSEYLGFKNVEIGGQAPRAKAVVPAARTEFKADPRDILMADFEGADYGDWTVEGEAFGSRPPIANVTLRHDVTGQLGKGLVNTCNPNDTATGKLTSPEFKIERNHINFLIGAGNHPGQTCMNLLLDGQVVRTAEGSATKDRGREVLRWTSWDVSEFAGQKAQLQIVDTYTGVWGHINIDHIFQSDTPRTRKEKNVEREDFTSKVRKIVFADTLEEQERQLAENPILERFRASRKKIQTDPHHPLYHFTSPETRLNDPNGLSFWKGNWHLFYQGYPAEDPRQHWGHAISDDLIHWRDLPYAIYPGPERACFSGSALVEKNRVIAMYYGTTVGCMVAVSDDPLLLNWEKVTGRAVIPHSKPGEAALPYSIFDPSIWKQGDYYYALTAGQSANGPGGKNVRAEFLHRSKDLANWDYLHPFLEGDRYGLIGDDGACPYFWPIGDKHILLHYSHISGGKYMLGDYDTERDKFVVINGGDFNFGPSGPSGVHAPSAAPDGKGGVIVIFNMNPGKGHDGWNQIMSLPRRLTLNPADAVDVIRVEPAGDTESLRYAHQQIEERPLPANDEIVLKNIEGNSMELIAEIDCPSVQMLELNVLRSANGEENTRIMIFPQRGYRHREFQDERRKLSSSIISLDTSRSSLLPDASSRAPETAQFYMDENETLKLHVFIDKSVVEVFVNGTQCVAARVYPGRKDSVGVSIRAQGKSATLKSLDAWQMKSIYER